MTKIIVVDTETTGLGDADEVIEVAVVRLDGGSASSLIRPRVPISVEARAAHHISDRDLARAPTMADLLLHDPYFFRADVLVAHNAEFDLRMLRQSRVPAAALPPRTICTWRCALHVFPDAPSYGNQVLRYHLGIGGPVKGDLPSHRALSDAIVTSRILTRMLEANTVDRLVELTTTPVLLRTVKFGKHAGKLWEDVDTDYLAWITSKSDFQADVLHTARHWLAERRRKRAALP